MLIRNNSIFSRGIFMCCMLLGLGILGALPAMAQCTPGGSSTVFNVWALDVGPGGGDVELNTSEETRAIWQAINEGQAVPGTVSANNTTYNIVNWEVDTENSINYIGNDSSDFGGDLA